MHKKVRCPRCLKRTADEERATRGTCALCYGKRYVRKDLARAYRQRWRDFSPPPQLVFAFTSNFVLERCLHNPADKSPRVPCPRHGRGRCNLCDDQGTVPDWLAAAYSLKFEGTDPMLGDLWDFLRVIYELH